MDLPEKQSQAVENETRRGSQLQLRQAIRVERKLSEGLREAESGAKASLHSETTHRILR